jgi:hypothetical protein
MYFSKWILAGWLAASAALAVDIGGVLIPIYSGPTHKSENGLGGWHSVSNELSRTNLVGYLRKSGMVVFQIDTSTAYTLGDDLVTWSPFASTNINLSGAISGGTSNGTLNLSVTDLDPRVSAAESVNGNQTAWINENRDNIYLNEFRRMAGDSATWGAMLGGVIDDYRDTNGINQAVSSNATFGAGGYSFIPLASSSYVPLYHYAMNDNAGDTVVVDTGSRLTNAVATANTSGFTTTGVVNAGFKFLGSQSVYIPGYKGVLGANPWSIAFWLHTTYVGDQQYYMMWGNDADNTSLQIQSYSGYGGVAKICIIPGNGADYFASNSDINNGEWRHFAATYDGNIVSMFIDGVLEIARTNITCNLSANQDLRIGQYMGGGGAGNNGEMDDWRLYDVALTPAQVAEIYNSGAGTESDLAPFLTGGAMNLQANPVNATTSPTEARGMALMLSNSVNTTVFMDVSGNNGANWDRLTLAPLTTFSNVTVYGATTNLTSPSTQMLYRVQSTTNGTGTVRGAAIMWR